MWFPSRRVSTTLLLAVAAILVLSSVRPATAGTDGFGLDLDQVVGPWFREPPAPTTPPTPALLGLADARHQRTEAAQHQPRRFPVRLLDDLPAVAAAPWRWEATDWRRLGLGVLAVGVVSLADEPVDRWFDDHRNAGADRAARDLRPLGQEAGLILLGAAWLGGRVADRPGLEAVGADGLEASLITALMIVPLKLAFGRQRPRATDEHGSFWSGGRSFPSGEAAQAFTLAAVVAAHSDRTWLKVTAWSLAGLVGVERLELDAHWVSDVTAGALIGCVVGRWVVARNRPSGGSSASFEVTPVVGQARYGVAMHLSF